MRWCHGGSSGRAGDLTTTFLISSKNSNVFEYRGRLFGLNFLLRIGPAGNVGFYNSVCTALSRVTAAQCQAPTQRLQLRLLIRDMWLLNSQRFLNLAQKCPTAIVT